MMKICFVLSFFATFAAGAQGGYQPGSRVADFLFSKVLNAPAAPASLKGLKSRLVILDFFGTWCVPCIKALPKLQQLQQNNKDIRVVLISVEEESRLKSFLDKRPGFPFPVVVDEKEAITALFQPPALPYTVVLNEAGQLLAITEAAEIDEKKINAWLSGSDAADITAVAVAPKSTLTSQQTALVKSSNKQVALSQDFLYAARTGDAVQVFLNRLQAMDYETLRSSLTSDAEKMAFWINLYNGFTQYSLRKDPEQYKSRNQFFKKKQFTVAGRVFSLDDMEHDILRRSKIKWSLGHLSKLFPAKWEKELRVDAIDYRIHFALNCGAKSCPPIAFYTPEKLEQQLDLAAKAYLGSEVEVREAENTVYLPAIMSWFRADFGGKKGMRELLRKHGFPATVSSAKIKFKDYDWNLYLDNDSSGQQ